MYIAPIGVMNYRYIVSYVSLAVYSIYIHIFTELSPKLYTFRTCARIRFMLAMFLRQARACGFLRFYLNTAILDKIAGGTYNTL